MNKVTCEFGCYDDKQCNVCKKGMIECSDSTLRVCTGIGWGDDKVCDYGCRKLDEGNATCNQECRPGVIDCVADKFARKCSKDGVWESGSINCDGGCDDGTGVCYPKETCTDMKFCNNDFSVFCNNNGEWEKTKCVHGCNDNIGECYLECKPGLKECTDINTSIECGEDGNVKTKLECEFGCNKNTGDCYPNCTPNDINCYDETTPQMCSENGIWIKKTPCSIAEVCKEGECASNLQDEMKCVNGGINKCFYRGINIDRSDMSICIEDKYITIPCGKKSDCTCDNTKESRDGKNSTCSCESSCTRDLCISSGNKHYKFNCEKGNIIWNYYEKCTDGSCNNCESSY